MSGDLLQAAKAGYRPQDVKVALWLDRQAWFQL
jgi:hypothetical protein